MASIRKSTTLESVESFRIRPIWSGFCERVGSPAGRPEKKKEVLPSGSCHQNIRGSGVELVEVAVDVHASDRAHELQPVEGHDLGLAGCRRQPRVNREREIDRYFRRDGGMRMLTPYKRHEGQAQRMEEFAEKHKTLQQ